MLKKLMSLAVIGMLMVGCTDTKESVKHEVPDTSNSTRQEQQVQPKKEEVKKEQEQPKEQIKKDTTKKEQNDNIDPETGLAKVKHGTHLQEEADKQDEDYGIWTKDYCPECGKPFNKCICDGDTDPDMDYSNTPVYDDYQEPDEFKDEEDEPTVKYYGINGKEQTKEEWYRDYKYINKGYNSHIDDDDNVYWTDEDGNEYR